ncbi:MAG: hypothetical protein MSA90_21935 [Faecalicatena sp.]|uniref:hypothetical protein n=1 Tax=Faecalicatena sp. TaxID=2005360 RepID=UPI00258BAE3C|nr:hypothetical protein [Faecalicatena sp.]MCI6468111.1 hypothetical protein [Faecalicatena sp.]MDY4670919.1 hypothetical protein [Oliverpabstia sp.]MDY5620364.1 hypothetical protein [Lachnospiraceae bacterium]
MMKHITLLGSKISNFESEFSIGQTVWAEIKGETHDLKDAYEIIINGKKTKDPYFPICNGKDKEGNKYLVCTLGKNLDKLYAFTSESAYIGD